VCLWRSTRADVDAGGISTWAYYLGGGEKGGPLTAAYVQQFGAWIDDRMFDQPDPEIVPIIRSIQAGYADRSTPDSCHVTFLSSGKGAPDERDLIFLSPDSD
jgi:hypothetical protein